MLAERAGFEPAIPIRYTGFRDRRIRPLCHLSWVDRQRGLTFRIAGLGGVFKEVSTLVGAMRASRTF